MSLSPPDTLPGKASPSRLDRPDAPRIESEIFQHREQRAAFGADPLDGLPRPVSEVSSEDAHVLPLSPETLICMADHSSFRLTGLPDVEFTPEEVVRRETGFYVSYQEAVKRAGNDRAHLVAFSARGSDAGFVPVEPKRRQCRHYVRQLTDFNVRRRGFMERMCTALRDDTGQFQSLRDTGLYACELRDPRDSSSEQTLEEFDAKKIAEGREREAEEQPFDVDAALNEMSGPVGSKEPLPGQLFGQWGVEHVPDLSRSRHALLLSDDGQYALSLIQPDDEWCVLSEAGAGTYLHSRDWLRGAYRFGWDSSLGSEWVAIESTFIGSDAFNPTYGPRSSGKEIHWRHFRITAVKGISYEEVAERFGPQAASASRHDQLALLLKVEERQEQS